MMSGLDEASFCSRRGKLQNELIKEIRRAKKQSEVSRGLRRAANANKFKFRLSTAFRFRTKLIIAEIFSVNEKEGGLEDIVSF